MFKDKNLGTQHFIFKNNHFKVKIIFYAECPKIQNYKIIFAMKF